MGRFRRLMHVARDLRGRCALLLDRRGDGGGDGTDFGDGGGDAVDGLDRFLGRGLDMIDLRADFLGCLAGLVGQAFHLGRHDRKELATKHIRWGEYVGRQKATIVAGTEKLTEVAQRMGAELDARHRQEMAQRAAAAQAFSQSMYQQQLLNQNQQIINSANRPVTTNCNRFGNTTNCTSY
jgi:hypothetical protein